VLRLMSGVSAAKRNNATAMLRHCHGINPKENTNMGKRYEYICYIDQEPIRTFYDYHSMRAWMDIRPEAIFRRKELPPRPPKEKLNTNDYPEALF
jgi:hypothetical protein